MMEQLKVRNKVKARKPEFNRQNANGHDDFIGSWRYPKGIQSKMRRGFRGKGAMPSVGYGSPRSVSGLSRKGLKLVLVHNTKDLEGLTTEYGVMIARSVGMRKRMQLLNSIKEKNLHVMGLKDINKFLEDAKKLLEERKKKEALKKDNREKIRKEAEKRKEDKKEAGHEDTKIEKAEDDKGTK